jgi:hypothetical protein
MIATFDGTWDWTAIGTLALAAATFVSLLFARRSLRQMQEQIKLGQQQLEQTQAEIALSRREVEEAHRPVVVPLADSRFIDITGYSGSGRPAARPAVFGEGQLTAPIENIGTGPALRIEASVQLLNDEGGPSVAGTGNQTPAHVPGLSTAVRVAPTIRVHGLTGLTGFWLTLTYEDVAGRAWVTKARYIKTRGRYEDVTVDVHPAAH